MLRTALFIFIFFAGAFCQGISQTTAKLSYGRGNFRAGVFGNRVLFESGIVNKSKVMIDESIVSVTASDFNSMVDIWDVKTKTWNSMPSNITLASEYSMVSLGSTIYVAGGAIVVVVGSSTNIIYYDNIRRYQPENNRWSDIGTLSSPSYYLAGTSVAGRYVLFGGGIYGGPVLSNVSIIDTFTNNISSSSLSIGRSRLAATSAGIFALFGGGADAELIPLNTVDIWNSQTGVWNTSALSVARMFPAATSVNGLALFAGGFISNINNYPASTVVNIWNSQTQTWLSPTTLTIARGRIAACSVGKYALFAGGVTGSLTNTIYSDHVDIWNSLTQSWTTPLTLSSPRGQLVGVGVGNWAVFAGGLGTFTDTLPLDSVDLINLPFDGATASNSCNFDPNSGESFRCEYKP
jgi:hypothetical protein